MSHDQTALMISAEEASRVHEELKRRLLANRKLSLVVDIDQTIIQATVDQTVERWQEDPSNPNYEAVKDVKRFQLVDEGPGGRATWYYIKLRPGLKEFFEKISQLYELHIYTMGTRAYAQNVMRFVDPDRKLFGDRILSRDENGRFSTSKSLDRLFPIDKSMVVMIDDRADVWKYDNQLVRVAPYNFFIGIGDINATFIRTKEQLDKVLPNRPAPPPNEQEKEEEPVKVDEESGSGDNDSSPPTDTEEKAPSPAVNGEITNIGEQLVAIGGGDDPGLLQEQLRQQDELIEDQIKNSPLAREQEKLDKADEEAVKQEQDSANGMDLQPHKRHSLLHDDDVELQAVEANLRQVHQAFFDEYDRRRSNAQGGRVAELRIGKSPKKRAAEDPSVIPHIENIMLNIKHSVLAGVSVVFSGVIVLELPVLE
jgi:RNA polymerase II subunit A C-terminal domain phosphatase